MKTSLFRDKNLTHMFTLSHISEASSNATAEGQDKSSLRLTKWHETFHLMYMKHLCITVGLEIA